MLVCNVTSEGAASTPCGSRSARQSNITSPRTPRGPEPQPKLTPADQGCRRLPTALVMQAPLRSVCAKVAGPGIVGTRSVVAGTGGAPVEILDGDSRRRSAGGGVPNPAQRGDSQTRPFMLIPGPFVEFSCASGPVQLTQSQAACGAMV